jgi:hypothetical protein
MSLSSYPKVYNLGHRAVHDLLSGPVVVQEKIDGSQFSFGVVPDGANGELKIRSRGQNIVPEAPPKMFAKAVETVVALRSSLVPGWVYRGEVLDKPKHNALAYDRVPKGNVILFDVEMGDQWFADAVRLVGIGQILGLETVPMIYDGPGSSLTLDRLKQWLDSVSILGGQKVEGVVIKAYGRFGLDGKTLMGKHVSEAFKEIAGGEWKAANPKLGDIIGQLIERYKTPARWEKAVQHLRDAGKLLDEPKDIGPLMGELRDDTLKECSQEIMDALFKWGWPRVMRGVAAGFAEWYKGKLAEKQFVDQPPVETLPLTDPGAGAALAQDP